MSGWEQLQAVWLWLEAHSVWLLLGGLIAGILLNGFLWRRDRARLERLRARSTRPPAEGPAGAPCPADEPPRVSILIPAWNEAAHLGRCLDSVRALRYPNREVIVCAGGTDGTLEIARRYADRRVIVLEQKPGEGKQRALQRCLEHATGEIVFLTDADCVLDDESFERAMIPVVTGESEVTTGSRRPLDEQEADPLVVYQWMHHLFMESHLPDEVDVLFGINAAIRREALERAGGFTAPAPIGTDWLLGRRLREAGYAIRFVPLSRVRTEYPVDLRTYLRQQSRWFRNRFIYGLRFRAWRDVLGHLWAVLTSLFMLVIPLTGGMGVRWFWALWLAGLAHLLLSQARVFGLAQRALNLRLSHRWHYALFALFMAAGWGVTVWGWVESLLPGRRWRW